MDKMLDRFGVGNRQVFALILASALLIVAARVLAPFEVGKDQASQLEAAQRLVAGLGLTTTNDVLPRSFDITESPGAKNLTWWPPGFSILAAGFLWLGVPLLAALKIIYALITLAGWIGWAILASQLLSRPLAFWSTERRVHLVIAALLPLFFTLWWGGTDIFLWAVIPFIFLLLFKGGTGRFPVASDLLAGLLFGAAYAMRYASLFLVLAAFLLLWQATFPNVKTLLQRYALFSLASFLIIIPTIIYLRLHAQPAGGLALNAGPAPAPDSLAATIKVIFICLPFSSSLIFGLPLIDQFIYKLGSTWLMCVTGAACLFLILSLPLVALHGGEPDARKFRERMAVALSWLPLSLIVFLVALKFFGYGDLLKVRRYYEPVGLCGILLFYSVASADAAPRSLKTAAKVIVAMFLCYVCLYLPALGLIPERRGAFVSAVLGFMPANDPKYASTSQPLRYPSNQIYSRKERSKQQLQQLYVNYPQALFFIDEYGYFIYDNFQARGLAPGARLRVFPRENYWRQAYTSQSIKVFWILEQETPAQFLPATAQIVFADPVEKVRIVAAELPAGYRFADAQLAALPSGK